jgi:hypothetical protein
MAGATSFAMTEITTERLLFNLKQTSIPLPTTRTQPTSFRDARITRSSQLVRSQSPGSRTESVNPIRDHWDVSRIRSVAEEIVRLESQPSPEERP